MIHLFLKSSVVPDSLVKRLLLVTKNVTIEWIKDNVTRLAKRTYRFSPCTVRTHVQYAPPF